MAKGSLSLLLTALWRTTAKDARNLLGQGLFKFTTNKDVRNLHGQGLFKFTTYKQQLGAQQQRMLQIYKARGSLNLLLTALWCTKMENAGNLHDQGLFKFTTNSTVEHSSERC